MNTRFKISRWWRKTLLGLAGVDRKSAPYMFPQHTLGMPAWKMGDYRSYVEDGFASNSLIYQALMYKARSISQVHFRGYTGTLDLPKPLPYEHELSQLLLRPNPRMSGVFFMMLQDLNLNIDGNAYSVKTIGEDGKMEMWPLRPDHVFIIPDKNRTKLLGYLYVPEGFSYEQGTPILAEDMLHIKFPNPGDPLEGLGYGASPMAALARSGDVDNMITKFLKIFWEKGAMVWYTLESDQDIPDNTAVRLKERFTELYGGYDKWGIAVLDNGTKLKRASLTFQEMNFDTMDERSEVRIIGPFGVPLELLATRMGVYRSTYNNRKEARRMFWEDTMMSEVGLLEAEYQYHLRRDDGAFIMADLSEVPALKADIFNSAQAFDLFVKNGIPINDAADLLDLPIPYQTHGDVPFLSGSLVLAENVINPPEPPPTFSNGQAAPGEEDREDELPDEEDEEQVSKFLIPVGTDPDRWLEKASQLRVKKAKLARLRQQAETLDNLKQAIRLLAEAKSG